MLKLSLAGRLGRDAEVRRTQAGDAICGFAVAVERRNGQNKETVWIDCSLFGKRGEALSQYLTKGTVVAVSGDLSTREHNGKTYLQCRADDVTLLGGKPAGERQEAYKPPLREPVDDFDDTDSVPF